MTEAKKAEAVGALRKCAKEHEKDVTYTGNVIVSNLCNDVADYVEELQVENAELKAQNEKMKCCGNCKHFIGDTCCSEDCHNMDEWEMKDGK